MLDKEVVFTQIDFSRIDTVETLLELKTIKMAIMQPYFMPYIGYFSLIKHTDVFILFDDIQFIRHGWIERNRVLKQNGDWLYIKVPLIKPNSRETTIKDCLIDNKLHWKQKILAQLQPYKKIAPNYFKVVALLNDIFEKDYTSIVDLNKYSLELICEYLGFKKELKVYSALNLNIAEVNAADEWALNICEQFKKQFDKIHYINPIGGLSIFDRNKYISKNIEISFIKSNLSTYKRHKIPFIPGLSILDILMFNSIEEVNDMLDDFCLV